MINSYFRKLYNQHNIKRISKNAGIMVALILLNSLVNVSVAAENPRIRTVEKLLFTSTAAQKIQNSGNPEAKKKQKHAQRLFNEAIGADGSGKTDAANELLTNASKTMFEATRMVDKKSIFIEKDRRDYATRLESINALLQAYDNISKEKSVSRSETEKLHSFVNNKLQKASALEQSGQVKQARKVLDEAYVATKIAIEHMRSGETLVRTLNFKSKEEEYHYEVDRNETHKMLISVLLQDKINSDDSMSIKVNKFMDKARVLRLQADKKAEQGDYEQAIGVMEQSTKEIVRAIRSAGIYIPG